MTKLNKDGFAPGQAVSFEEMVKANASRKAVKSEPITRESIAKMSKSDVADLLKMHGVESPDGKVADLRADLIAIMFMGD